MQKFIKPLIPSWKILLFSLGFFGVEFSIIILGASLPEFTAIFGQTGYLAFLWLFIPITAIFIQPIMGFVGDHVWSSYGKRNLFLLTASFICAVSIFIFAHSGSIISSLIFLFIILACLNTLLVSYRTLISEMTSPKDRLSGYAILAILQLSGILAAIFLKYSVIKNSSEFHAFFGTSSSDIFGLLIATSIILFVTVFLGAFFIKEHSKAEIKNSLSYVPFNPESEEDILSKYKISYIRQGAMWLSVATIVFLVFNTLNFAIESYIVPFVMAIFATLLMITNKLNKSKTIPSKNEKRFVEIITDIMNMPILMKKLNLVILFVWFGIFMFLYNLKHIIYGNPNLQLFEKLNAMTFNLEVNCYIYIICIAIITIMILLLIGNSTLNRYILTVSILMESIFMLIYLYYPIPLIFILNLTVIGILLGIVLTLPYVILSLKLPSKRLGLFLGLFNIFMVIPYIMIPSTLNSIINNTANLHNGLVFVSLIALCLSFVISMTIKKSE